MLVSIFSIYIYYACGQHPEGVGPGEALILFTVLIFQKAFSDVLQGVTLKTFLRNKVLGPHFSLPFFFVPMQSVCG